LSLRLKCIGVSLKQSGVEKIINQGDVKTFEFKNIPATSDCLSGVSLSLESSYAYPDRPIKFAQGSDGTVKLNLPLPGQSTPSSSAVLDRTGASTSSPSSNEGSNVATSTFSLAILIAWLRAMLRLWDVTVSKIGDDGTRWTRLQYFRCFTSCFNTQPYM
jgi:hypothetical protein